MNLGIHYSFSKNLENAYQEFKELKELGINTLSISCVYEDWGRYIELAKKAGITHFMVDVYWDYKKPVDEFDVDIYYVDEPYETQVEKEGKSVEEVNQFIKERADYVSKIRPNSKFVVGGVRHILTEDYKPYKNTDYTYTAYTNGIFQSQTPQWIEMYKKFHEKFSVGWVYGNIKFIPPIILDEYKRLHKYSSSFDHKFVILYRSDSNFTEKMLKLFSIILGYNFNKKYQNYIIKKFVKNFS